MGDSGTNEENAEKNSERNAKKRKADEELSVPVPVPVPVTVRPTIRLGVGALTDKGDNKDNGNDIDDESVGDEDDDDDDVDDGDDQLVLDNDEDEEEDDDDEIASLASSEDNNTTTTNNANTNTNSNTNHAINNRRILAPRTSTLATATATATTTTSSTATKQAIRPSLLAADEQQSSVTPTIQPSTHRDKDAEKEKDATPSARRADPLQHNNDHARMGVTIAAAYATGSVPAYSKNSNKPYIPERMAVHIPNMLKNHDLIPSIFQTTTPLPLELHSLLDAASVPSPNASPPPSSSDSNPSPSTAISPNPSTKLLEATQKIASLLASSETTTGPLPDAFLESQALLPPQTPAWLPSELDALDRGLELYGKNFTRISRDCVQSRSTADCIHAYYARKHDLRSVKVKKYRKKVGKEDEEYVKYVGGLAKYVAMESKRMKTEKMLMNGNGGQTQAHGGYSQGIGGANGSGGVAFVANGVSETGTNANHSRPSLMAALNKEKEGDMDSAALQSVSMDTTDEIIPTTMIALGPLLSDDNDATTGTRNDMDVEGGGGGAGNGDGGSSSSSSRNRSRSSSGGGIVKVAEIEGLMSSVKGLNENGIGVNGVLGSANGITTTTTATTTAPAIAGTGAPGGGGGEEPSGRRTRRSAAAAPVQ